MPKAVRTLKMHEFLRCFHYVQLPPAWCSCLMCPLAVQFQKIKIFIHLVLEKITNFLGFISVSIWVWQLCSGPICSMEQEAEGRPGTGQGSQPACVMSATVTARSRGADLCPQPPCHITRCFPGAPKPFQGDSCLCVLPTPTLSLGQSQTESQTDFRRGFRTISVVVIEMSWDQHLLLYGWRSDIQPVPCSWGAASALWISSSKNACFKGKNKFTLLERVIDQTVNRDAFLEGVYWIIFFILKCNVFVSHFYHLACPTSKTITAIMRSWFFFSLGECYLSKVYLFFIFLFIYFCLCLAFILEEK